MVLILAGSSCAGGDAGPRLTPEDKSKAECEISFWRARRNATQAWTFPNSNIHPPTIYGNFMTRPFRLTRRAFAGKKVLDVGCGPTGGLTWLTGIADSVTCADPLAEEYGKLGNLYNHSIVYVSSGVERLPFIANSFDIVTSINNFDHVSHPRRGLRELRRVLRPQGSLLMIVEIHPVPTKCEPLMLGWSRFEQEIQSAGFRKTRLLRKIPAASNGHQGTKVVLSSSFDQHWEPPGPNSWGYFVGHFS